MLARLHHSKDTLELLKVQSLLRFQRVLDEKWNDALPKVGLTSHSIRHPVAVILSNHAASEIRLECVEHLHIAFVLYDGELRKNLIANCHVNMLVDAHMKAAFTVHETCNPLCVEFHRLVPNVKSLRVPGTVPGLPCGLSPCPSDSYCYLEFEITSTERLWEEFPAYGSVLLRLAIPNLRTVLFCYSVKP